MTMTIKPFLGYLSLLLSAGFFLGDRALLIGYLDGNPEVVPTLSLGLALAFAAVAFGAVGVWLLVPERYLVVVAAICFLLLAGPSLLGATLDLTDYLSASGYANFGAVIILWIGNSVLLVGAVFSIIVLAACVSRQIVNRTKGPLSNGE